MNFKYKLVMVIRDDLDLSTGKLAVQASHAAVSCAVECQKNNKRLFKRWMKEGQKKVLVKCDDAEHLESLRGLAVENGLITKVVSDAGRTEVSEGTKTCLGIGPGPEDTVDKVTGDLSLF